MCKIGNVQNGAQQLQLDADCQTDKTAIAHELMHLLGFYHEQNRADRDSYIFIDFNKLPGQQDQYIKQMSGSAFTTPYDYQSIMHYSASAGLYVFRVVLVLLIVRMVLFFFIAFFINIITKSKFFLVFRFN